MRGDLPREHGAPRRYPTGVPSRTSDIVEARLLRGVTSATIEAAGGVKPASPIPTTRRIGKLVEIRGQAGASVAADQTTVAAAMIRLREKRSASSPSGRPVPA